MRSPKVQVPVDLSGVLRRARDDIVRTVIRFSDIEAARERIGARIYLSPCAYSETISQMAGHRVFFKLENLQMTGSFKERGALNRLLKLSKAEARRGVVAASAGNHGMAIAFHSRRLGVPAVVVMPNGAPLIKVAWVRRYGARAVLAGSDYDAAYDEARQIAERDRLTFVHAFDDPDVIAGQGTVGLELHEQAPELDAVLVPVGGGGLIAGLALALKERRPSIKVIGVQTERLPSLKAALDEGRVVQLPAASTIADGIAVRAVGELPLEIARRYVDGVVAVSEAEIANAVLCLLEIEKTVAEGAAAVPLAALLNRKVSLDGARQVVLIVSGGNIDMNLISRIIEKGLIEDGRLSRLTVSLPDRPGQLARLAQCVANEHANVLRIEHVRSFGQLEIGETEVELILETAGAEHIERLRAAVRREGFQLKEGP